MAARRCCVARGVARRVTLHHYHRFFERRRCRGAQQRSLAGGCPTAALQALSVSALAPVPVVWRVRIARRSRRPHGINHHHLRLGFQIEEVVRGAR
jgi:hypothetical protein